MSQAPQQQSSASSSKAYEPPATQQPILVLSSHENDLEWQRRVLTVIGHLAERRGLPLDQSLRVETHSPAWWARDKLADLPEGSVVVALLSEAFLNAVRPHDHLEQILERIGRSVQVIPVVAEACDWEKTPFVTRQAFPRSARCLSDLTADASEQEMLFLADLVLERFATSNVGDADLTVRQLREMPLAGSVDWLLGSSTRYVQPANGVITSLSMLTAMAANGKTEGDAVWVCDILRRAVDPAAARALLSRDADPDHDAPNVASEAHPGRRVTRDLYDAFVSAREIARKASGDETIHARHLLASLITTADDPDPLGALGVEQAPFCKELVEFVMFDSMENRAEWERVLLGDSAPDRRLFDFHADSPGDTDLLGIDRDVAAFATLIAARDVNPPLSVGLFGDWGSGKSFFMRELRKAIERLAEDARASKEMQCNWPFYKRIVQVEFNAWHYVDGNLWASLVQHILDNLRPAGDKSASRQLQQHLLKELKFASSTEVEAQAAVVAATTAVSDTSQDLAEAQTELEEKRVELQELAAQDVTTNFVLESIASFAKETMSELRIAPVDASADELKKALSGAKAVVSGGSPLLTPLQRSKDRDRLRLMFILSMAAVPVVVLLVRWYLNVRNVDFSGFNVDIAAVATFLAGTLSTLAVWVKKGSTWLEARRKEVDELQRRYDADVATKLAEHQRMVSSLGEEVQRKANELAAAKQKHEEAKQRVAAATAELEDATSGRLLARFVEDRAGSTDYRKHLGVLAVVRRDFESLSDLIQEENWRLLPAVPGDDDVQRIKPKFTSLEEEQKEENIRINRIVLYIDDLDRCPPGKVVDVLQAVHLLLAFPLFVVVVGVDARWIARSLETKYRELLLTEKPNAGDRYEEVFGRATTNDYLEKIFQVPYWIRPMDETSSTKMIRGLLKHSVAPHPAEVPPPVAGAAAHDDAAAAAPAATDATATRPISGGTGDTRSTVDSATPSAGTNGKAKDAGHETRARQQLASLVVHDAELEIISQLTPLLGRSPRALKRFVNVYRLLKASLSPDEQNQFHRAGLSDSWAVLFLLAVDTGAPLAAHPIFDAVSHVAASNTPTLSQLRTHLNDRIALELKQRLVNPDWAADWKRVDDWLDTQRAACSNQAILSALNAWAPRVARYSFHAVRERIG